MIDPSTTYCDELASPGWFQPVLSTLIILGILISYLPQHIRIISRRSSFGISPYFVLLGTTSGTSAFVNILVFPKTAADVTCCQEISGLACFAGLLGVFQMGMQWLCFFSILLLFVIYFPRATSPTDPTHSVSSTSNGPTYRTALAITAICLLHALVTVIISVAFAIRRPSALHSWANFLGIVAAILASIQYFPQIYTTYRLRCVGSLSIPMMCIQTPGSLVWAASLAAREGAKGWSIWGVLLVTASLQGTLLVMAIYFEYFGPDSKRKVVHRADQDGYPNGTGAERSDGHASAREPIHAERPSEETPLLQSQ
ncbi:Putative PQ loop repeat protein [Penicillium brasilianum]|uniref:Putative PQ loop repeat protein n=1 Tax=Penicillium brasilianum TaxID=104259 RepID=A0A0F7TKT4_PENBI|nr:Putative PQ loop repeat protein [Penicillium brasilianum]